MERTPSHYKHTRERTPKSAKTMKNTKSTQNREPNFRLGTETVYVLLTFGFMIKFKTE